jgi:hypothetical protein
MVPKSRFQLRLCTWLNRNSLERFLAFMDSLERFLAFMDSLERFFAFMDSPERCLARLCGT